MGGEGDRPAHQRPLPAPPTACRGCLLPSSSARILTGGASLEEELKNTLCDACMFTRGELYALLAWARLPLRCTLAEVEVQTRPTMKGVPTGRLVVKNSLYGEA